MGCAAVPRALWACCTAARLELPPPASPHCNRSCRSARAPSPAPLPAPRLAINDFRRRDDWACPVGSPQPCSVSGDAILAQLGFEGNSLGTAFLGLLLLAVRSSFAVAERGQCCSALRSRWRRLQPTLPAPLSILGMLEGCPKSAGLRLPAPAPATLPAAGPGWPEPRVRRPT